MGTSRTDGFHVCYGGLVLETDVFLCDAKLFDPFDLERL